MSESMQRKIAFSMLKGMNAYLGRALIKRVGGIDRFFDLRTYELWDLICAQKKYCTDDEREKLLARAQSELNFITQKNINATFFTDSDYPTRLADCEDAPAVLYRLGADILDSQHIISVVGTRKATAYGVKLTTDIIAGLAELLPNPVIVSGLAYGIDIAAHKAALDNDIPTVAVVAHGLRTIYPAEHRNIAAKIISKGGAIVTEYPSDAPVYKGNFLARNRIVSGLSDIVIVVESELQGGAMVTAAITNEYGRELGAVPGRTIDRYSAGPNALIQSTRAVMIREAEDIIACMNWKAKEVAPAMPMLPFDDLDPEKMRIVDYLRDHPDATPNDMVQELCIPYAQLSSWLMEMEMDDLISSKVGQRYNVNF